MSRNARHGLNIILYNAGGGGFRPSSTGSKKEPMGEFELGFGCKVGVASVASVHGLGVRAGS